MICTGVPPRDNKRKAEVDVYVKLKEIVSRGSREVAEDSLGIVDM